MLNDNYNTRFARASRLLNSEVRLSYKLNLKRVIDILGAITGLIVFSPIMLVAALLIRLTMGKEVLFRQQRPGLHGKPFFILKFKTMRDALGKDGKPLPDDKRLTGLGKFLRASSLDELPGLINVLKGEMSLVGPRPLLMSYLERYTPEQARRHEVRPGITGWAQVNGRNAISWEEKFSFDVWYVDHQSLALDLKILYLTVLKVVFREGINHANHATMPEFKGKDVRSHAK